MILKVIVMFLEQLSNDSQGVSHDCCTILMIVKQLSSNSGLILKISEQFSRDSCDSQVILKLILEQFLNNFHDSQVILK